MMTSAIALLSGVIASSITFSNDGVLPAETLWAMYCVAPHEATGLVDMHICGTVWNDPYEKPSGFTGSSMYLGGNNKATKGIGTISASSDSHNVGSGDFTIEFWTKGDGVPTALATIMGRYYTTTSYRGWYVDVNYSNRSIDFTLRTETGANRVAQYVIGSGSWNTFWASWHHIVIQRDDLTITIYVDGVAGGVVSTLTAGDQQQITTTIGFWIGGGAYSTNRLYYGWIDDFRITKGVVRYTSAPFTPPGQLPVGGSDPDWANVSMFYGFDDTFGINLAGTSGYTKTDVVYTLKRNGNFLSALSIYGMMNRSSQEFQLPVNTLMSLGSDDFTFEMEAYKAGTGNYFLLSGAPGINIPFPVNGGGNFTNTFKVIDPSAADIFSYAQVTAIGNWYKFAIVRLGSQIRYYVNGSLVTTGSISGNICDFSNSYMLLTTTASSESMRVRGIRISRGAKYIADTYTPSDSVEWLDVA